MKTGLKKLMALGLVAMMAVGVLAGCGKDDSDQLSTIKDNGKLVIGTSPDYPPFEFLVAKDGKSDVVGADIDLAQKVADKAGVKLEIKTMDFDALIPALQAGKVDMVITGMSPNEKRKKSVDFSDIYFKGENAVLINKDNDKIKTIDDLKKVKIGVQKGSTQETFVSETLGIKEFKSLAAIPDLVQDMKNGNIDAIVLNSKVAGINAQKYDGIKVSDLKLSEGGDTEEMAIAFKKGNNQSFIELANGVISDLQKSGEYDKILANAVDLVSKQQ